MSKWRQKTGSGETRRRASRGRGALVATEYADLCTEATAPRRRASRGRGALVATEYADLRTVATAPRRRASHGRGELPLDRKRHRSNGRAGARPSRCPFVADAMNCVPPSAMRDGEGAIATIPARECKTTIYQLPTINYQLSQNLYTSPRLKSSNAQMQSQIVNRKSQISD